MGRSQWEGVVLSPEEPSGNSHGCSQVKRGPGQRPPKERSQVRDHRPQARLRSVTVLGGSGSCSRTHRPICGPSLSAGNHVTMMDRAPPPCHELGTSLGGQAHRSSLLTTGPEPARAHCLPLNSSLVLRPRESEPLMPTLPPPAPHPDSSQRPPSLTCRLGHALLPSPGALPHHPCPWKVSPQQAWHGFLLQGSPPTGACSASCPHHPSGQPGARLLHVAPHPSTQTPGFAVSPRPLSW